jgi:glutamine cyclotransferase
MLTQHHFFLKVDMKTGKVRKIIDLSDIRCNLLWIYCDPHAGQYGRLYLIGSRDGSIFLFKAIDLPKS